jgi:hypothetical protein
MECPAEAKLCRDTTIGPEVIREAPISSRMHFRLLCNSLQKLKKIKMSQTLKSFKLFAFTFHILHKMFRFVLRQSVLKLFDGIGALYVLS